MWQFGCTRLVYQMHSFHLWYIHRYIKIYLYVYIRLLVLVIHTSIKNYSRDTVSSQDVKYSTDEIIPREVFFSFTLWLVVCVSVVDAGDGVDRVNSTKFRTSEEEEVVPCLVYYISQCLPRHGSLPSDTQGLSCRRVSARLLAAYLMDDLTSVNYCH